MSILENNRNVLSQLWHQYPENLEGLSLEGNNLIYKGERIDISNFDIAKLLNNQSLFLEQMSVLSAEDIFRIIRLHAVLSNSKENNNTQSNLMASQNQEKLEALQREKPMFKNIKIVNRFNGVSNDEYFNIVDSKGNTHLFYNDRNVDLFNLYAELISRYGENINIDTLIDEVNRKLHEVALDSASEIMDNELISEEFKNKTENYNYQYKDEKTVNVLGNSEHDITVLVDSNDPSKHEVITYQNNEFGDLIAERHNNDALSQNSFVNSEELEFKDKKQEEQISILINENDFYYLINSGRSYSEEERKEINLWYAYLGDMIIYEDFLSVELKDILARFRNYITQLQISDSELNQNQLEACEKLSELEQNKEKVPVGKDKVEVVVKKLELTNKRAAQLGDDAFIASAQIIVSMAISVAILAVVALIVMV